MAPARAQPGSEGILLDGDSSACRRVWSIFAHGPMTAMGRNRSFMYGCFWPVAARRGRPLWVDTCLW